MIHGRRRTYQTGCHCDLCTAANTLYEARYREACRVGRRPLGAHVAGTAVARAIAALVDEGYTRTQIAHALGRLRVQYRDRVTIRSDVRVRRLLRQWTR